MSELPKGWVQTELNNLLSFVIGGDWGKEPNYSDVEFEDVYCIRGTEFKNWRKEKGLSAVHRRVKSASLEKRELILGDILIEISGGGPDQPVGRTLLIDQPALNIHKEHPKVCTNFVRLARPHTNINSSYLNYYLHSFYLSGEVKNYQGGSNNLRNLKFKDYSQILIPTAPLNEQIRIADKLDSILAKVDAAQARLDKIPNILKRFRQSVLATATSGELTKEWRGIDGIIESVASTWEIKNLPLTWQVKLLPELGTSRLGKMLDKSKNVGIETKYLGNINVRWNSFDLDDLKEIKVSEKEVKELSIENGDLIICEGGVPGRGAVWKGGVNNLVFQKALHRIRFEELIIPEFALYCIEDDFNSSRLLSLYTGTTIKHLTGKALKSYPLRLPPIEEQKEIIRRVESLFTMADTVEKQYKDAKAKTDRLTQSILSKAFRGELVPQDENDEPAGELVKRITEMQMKLKKVTVKKLKPRR